MLAFGMGLDATARRRWLGGIVLLGALGMLIAGETVLQGRLNPLEFLLYWLVCLALTSLAILIAFQDVRAVQRRLRQEKRDLLQSTLERIAADAKNRRRP